MVEGINLDARPAQAARDRKRIVFPAYDNSGRFADEVFHQFLFLSLCHTLYATSVRGMESSGSNRRRNMGTATEHPPSWR